MNGIYADKVRISGFRCLGGIGGPRTRTRFFLTDVGFWTLSLIMLFLEHLFYNFILTSYLYLVYFQGELNGYTSYRGKDADAALKVTEAHEC